MHNFKELIVWKAGVNLSKLIFKITRDLPSEEKFGLISQMMRCVVSIPSNIAEGCGRKSNKELHHFLSIAVGSSFELETQIILAREFNYITEEQLQIANSQITEIQKMLYGFQKSLAS